MTTGASVGVLTTVVWPAYLGLATGDPGPGPLPMYEPFDDFNYSRGQIWWTPQPDGDILGSAQVFAPQGEYWYYVYCRGPAREMMINAVKLAHPIIFDRPGIIDIEPIRNMDHLPRLNGLPRFPA